MLLLSLGANLSASYADFNLSGLGRGGQQVLRAKEVYAKAVETLVELASLQTAFAILDEVISFTIPCHALSRRLRRYHRTS